MTVAGFHLSLNYLVLTPQLYIIRSLTKNFLQQFLSVQFVILKSPKPMWLANVMLIFHNLLDEK